MIKFLSRLPLPPLALVFLGTLSTVFLFAQLPNKPQRLALENWTPVEVTRQSDAVHVTFEMPADLERALSWVDQNTPFLEARQPWARPIIEEEIIEYQEPAIEQIPIFEPSIVEDLPIPNFKLLGMLVNGNDSRALLIDIDTKIEMWVSVGQVIFGNWVVSEIQPRQVKLLSNGTEIVANFID